MIANQSELRITEQHAFRSPLTAFGPLLSIPTLVPQAHCFLGPSQDHSSVRTGFAQSSFSDKREKFPHSAGSLFGGTNVCLNDQLGFSSSSVLLRKPNAPHSEVFGAVLTPVSSPCDNVHREEQKRSELLQIQSFVQESKLLRQQFSESIYGPEKSKRDLGDSTGVVRLSNIQDSHRSLSQTEGVENIAELRRNIAEKYASKIPQKTERIISGVFVSYPEKRPESPRSPEMDTMQDRLISQFKPVVGKMTIEEYTQLRKNLLMRSEEHAVSN